MLIKTGIFTEEGDSEIKKEFILSVYLFKIQMCNFNRK